MKSAGKRTILRFKSIPERDAPWRGLRQDAAATWQAGARLRTPLCGLRASAFR